MHGAGASGRARSIVSLTSKNRFSVANGISGSATDKSFRCFLEISAFRREKSLVMSLSRHEATCKSDRVFFLRIKGTDLFCGT